MAIIQNELRLKDAEWVEKTLAGLKKAFRGTGNASLAEKAKKQEIDTVEKALKALTEDNKDIRKVDWSNKEVSDALHFKLPSSPFPPPLFA
jgi:obg-like ATPase 1